MTILKNKNIHSLANNGIVAVFGLVNFLLMARSLSQEEVGQWGIFIAGTTLLERLRTGLMQSALINYTVGTSHETSRAYHTAAWWLASLITLAVVVMVEGIAYFLDTSTHFSSFRLFFNFFSITYFATLPAYHAYWIKLATQQFLHVLLLRTITFGGFFLVLVSHYFFFPLTMREVAWAYVSCHSLSSLIAWLLRWSDWKSYLFVSLEKVKHLFQFGKYSVGSQLGEHLLKSVDSFMIGYFFSASAVAIYQVPNKIVEGFEILMRSFGINLHNQLALLFKQANYEDFRQKLYLYIRSMSFFFLGIALFIIFPWANILIEILVGDTYSQSADVLRIFMVFYLFMPLFKFTDIGLDACWKPHAIYYKTSAMVLLNILGNLAVIRWQPSLENIAVVSIGVYGLGAFAGWYMLNKLIALSWRELFYGKTN